MTSVGEQFPEEQARVRELLGIYRELGPSGAFGAAVMDQVLKNADQAMASGDIVEIIKAFAAMQDCK